MALLNCEGGMKNEESRMARRRIASRALALFFLFFILHFSFAAEPLPESQVKAAFLINFPRYVEWPAAAFTATNSPIVIAVLGKTEVTAELQKIIAGRIVNGRSIVLKQLVSGDETGGCHILFLSAAESQLAPFLLAKLKDRSVLTVGESADFLERGGLIKLTRRDQKIALEINLSAADQAGLKISSKLLSVASVVKGKPK
jgi:hypothetical protein